MLKNKLNRKTFIKTGLFGGVFAGLISLFIPKIRAENNINKLKNIDEKFNVSTEDLSNALNRIENKTFIRGYGSDGDYISGFYDRKFDCKASFCLSKQNNKFFEQVKPSFYDLNGTFNEILQKQLLNSLFIYAKYISDNKKTNILYELNKLKENYKLSFGIYE